mmetsp:Transcript_8251/g.35028  ORF Transcript_8251/g.35028 Transcript_8251/m.35028 type:complete len:222 (-) Transcript_8251:1228-1893(-)
MSIPPNPSSRCASHSPSASSAASARAAAAVPGGTGELISRGGRAWKRGTGCLFSGAEMAGPETLGAAPKSSTPITARCSTPRAALGGNALWSTPAAFAPAVPSGSALSRIATIRARSAATRASPGASAAAFSASATAPSNADAAAYANARRKVASAEFGSTTSAASATRAAFCASPNSSAHVLTSIRHSSFTLRASALASTPSNASSYSTKRNACSQACVA